MSRLRVGDLGDSTHNGPENYGHVRVRGHPEDGLADSLQGRDRLCDAPKPGGPLTTRQPAEYKWRSGYPTPL